MAAVSLLHRGLTSLQRHGWCQTRHIGEFQRRVWCQITLDRLAAADVSPRRPKGLIEEAWRIADRLGWAKTYDAEYLALAQLLKCRLLTTDAKLKAAGSGQADVIGPADL
jgi:hypothetical protein